jgi:hypothetical protein
MPEEKLFVKRKLYSIYFIPRIKEDDTGIRVRVPANTEFDNIAGYPVPKKVKKFKFIKDLLEATTKRYDYEFPVDIRPVISKENYVLANLEEALSIYGLTDEQIANVIEKTKSAKNQIKEE